MAKPKRRLLRKCLAALVVLLLITAVMLRWLERRLVYFPSRQMAATAAGLGRPWEDVALTSSDGVRLHGWFFPAPTNSPRARLVFLALHGNAGNISHRLDYDRLWLELGVNVFALDYRGYGLSEGRPGEQGTYQDAQAACAWLKAKGFSHTHLIVVGESLGGGVASEVARREQLGGLVLQGAFTSLPAVGAELYPWLPVRWMSTIRYDTLAKLPQLKCPVLVMHSRADELVGFHHAEQNFAAAREPKQFCPLVGGHNDALEANPAAYREGLEQFLRAFFP
jgi:uncharacterized protein